MVDVHKIFELPEALTKRGVIKIQKQGNRTQGYTILIIIKVGNLDKITRFDIGKRWQKTLENYDIAIMGMGLNDELKAAIKTYLIEKSEDVIGYSSKELVKYEEKEPADPTSKQMSVTEAIRSHSGTVKVSGMIVMASELFKLVKIARWACSNCTALVVREVKNILEPLVKPAECIQCDCKIFEGKHEMINCVSLGIQEEIQDQENPLDDLNVMVLNDDTLGIQIGEIANIKGEIRNKYDSKSKRYHTVVLASSIQYQHRKKLELEPEDRVAIKLFRTYPNYQQRLVSMFAPNIIDNADKKLALLLATIGAPESSDKQVNTIRGRINVLLIGPPGLAKTKLGREVIKLRQNSKYVSAKNTTGKSMTAMILPMDEKLTVHLGPVPFAKNAICFVNEFDKLPPEDADSLLEVMEEGTINMNKFAKNLEIPSPTTIMASANPCNNEWKDPDKISLEEIPFSAAILNRFDIVLTFRDIKSKEADRKYAYAKTEYDQCNIKHNYNFLQKLIEYCKTINPCITTQAEGLLNEYWVLIREQAHFASNPRTLDIIHRIAKAFARMYLSSTIDEQIAAYTIEFMNRMRAEFHCAIYLVPDPFMESYNEAIKVIQNQKETAIDLIEAVKMACARNEQAAQYIGKIFSQNRNKMLRRLCSKIIENESIVRVREHPTVVLWRSDLGDLSDPVKQPHIVKNKKNHAQSTNKKNKNSKVRIGSRQFLECAIRIQG
jgi:DNA replicative helicase MCM subunit Mcm2 (Cdc46/Mcm family)